MGRTPAASSMVRDSPMPVNLTIRDVVASWQGHLRAANKAPRTIQTYLDALTHFDRFRADRGMPRDVGAIRREHIEEWMMALSQASRKPASIAKPISIPAADKGRCTGQGRPYSLRRTEPLRNRLESAPPGRH